MTPEKLGKYLVIRQLGAGGFGEVFLCTDPFLDRDVAVKLFRIHEGNAEQVAQTYGADAESILRTRFLEEARVLRDLSSNLYIAHVFEFNETENGEPFYVMPYLASSLRDRMGKDLADPRAGEDLPLDQRPRKLPLDAVMTITRELLMALEDVHACGLVHRDIKPANILFDDDGRVQLADFGVAKLPEGDFSRTGVGIGSGEYMSPEQRDSAKHVKASSDIYSVGVLMYRMVTGRLPIGRYVPANEIVPDLSRALNDLIDRCLKVDAGERPDDGGDLLSLLVAAEKQPDGSEDDGITEMTVFSAPQDPPAGDEPEKSEPEEVTPEIVTPEIVAPEAAALEIIETDGEKPDEPEPEVDLPKIAIPVADGSTPVPHSFPAGRLFLVLLLCGLGALGYWWKTVPVKQPWQTQLELKATTAYENFMFFYHDLIKRIPDTPEQESRKQQDDARWLQVAEGDLASGYDDYLANFPEGTHRSQAMEKGSTARIRETDRDDWDRASADFSISLGTLATYLEDHPQGQFVAEAKTRMASLSRDEENNVWKKVETAGTKNGIMAFLEAYPAGANANNARAALAEIEAVLAAAQSVVEIEAEQNIAIPVPKSSDVPPQILLQTQVIYNNYPDLERLKRNLIRLGLDVDPDDQLTPETTRAIKRAQRWLQMPNTGVPGEELLGLSGKYNSAERHAVGAPFRACQDCPQMVVLPVGAFDMGQAGGFTEPVRRIFIDYQLAVARFEVSVAEWALCVVDRACEEKDTGGLSDDHPINNVTWYQAREYIVWLEEKTGFAFRMLSEAEWEYAARGGSALRYPWGDEMADNRAVCAGCTNGETPDGPSTVGSQQPNGFGLYDMQGNVAEWVQDCWAPDHRDAPVDGYPFLPAKCDTGLTRGGGFDEPADAQATYARKQMSAVLEKDNQGFRVALPYL